MKKFSAIISILLLILLIAGCSQGTSTHNQDSASTPAQSASKHEKHSDKNSNTGSSSGSSVRSTQSSSESTQTVRTSSTSQSSSDDSASSSSVETGTLAQVLREIRTNLKTSGRLPQNLTADPGKYFSATTQQSASGYTINFKQTNQPVKVNALSLTRSKTIATLKVIHYSSAAAAAKQFSFHKYGKEDGEPVNLGNTITGYQDAGAGTAGTSWNEGRWTLMALSPTEGAAKGVALAKNVVSFLQAHSLPVPHQYGVVQVYTDNRQNLIRWQDGRIIYQLSGISDPTRLLTAAVSMK